MQPDSFWAKVVRAARPGSPLFRIKASPFWTEVLVAAGMQRGRTEDTMPVELDESAERLPRQTPQRGAASTDTVSGIQIVRPRKRSDLGQAAEILRDRKPVILDLTRMSDAAARRAVDTTVGMVLGRQALLVSLSGKVAGLIPVEDNVRARAVASRLGYRIRMTAGLRKLLMGMEGGQRFAFYLEGPESNDPTIYLGGSKSDDPPMPLRVVPKEEPGEPPNPEDEVRQVEELLDRLTRGG